MKIVSLFPAGSEIICNLGLSDNLVAVSHECDFPPLLNKKIRVTKSIIPKSIDQRMIDQLVKNSPRAVNPNGRTVERILSITHQPR